MVGYVSDTYTDDSTHRDEVRNHWRGDGFHYECHHDECYVTATAHMYFTSEEEYLLHWNAFHAAIGPWFICPVPQCPICCNWRAVRAGLVLGSCGPATCDQP